MKLRLVRLEFNSTETLGVLLLNDKIYCATLELPWKNNQRNISCIPEGVYPVTCKESPHFGFVPHLLGVAKRSNVLIHAGNTHKDTKGCILIGMEPGYLEKERAVLRSRTALNYLIDLLSDTAELTILVRKEERNETGNICHTHSNSGDFGY